MDKERNSRKKWQVVLTILFALVYPLFMPHLLGYKAGTGELAQNAILALSVVPPGIGILWLPYKKPYLALAAAFYMLVMGETIAALFSAAGFGTPA